MANNKVTPSLGSIMLMEFKESIAELPNEGCISKTPEIAPRSKGISTSINDENN